jgi:hypothetical protein
MRRKRAFKRSRAASVLIAGFVGYVVGGWNPSMPHKTDLSAAQMVALRFPQDLSDASSASSTMPVAAASAKGTADARLALLNPEPMVPQAPAATIPQTAVQTAAVEQATPPRSVAPGRPAPAAAQTSELKPIAAAVHRRNSDRPGFILNDAQIASIKDRLHLTPDQEEMWPAVEAALRNLAYTRAREAHRRGGATDAQLASADPGGSEVQGLKSAAIPLLMSFNSEQKDEVRSLAHVMGLDQLATQF